ncbi:MarC family protein [Kingella denitrificans]|uniref:MarC family protein n=1 Tax=Kingella denitrificans TaxID=502 RepID=UPI000B99AECF|nr:MarC family protein [Kingella denitrificans]
MHFEIGKIILSLMVLVNPFSALSIFLELTQGYTSRERRRTAQITALSVFIIMTVFVFSGNWILKILSISTGSFQVGGGILVFLIAVSMMNSGSNPAKPKIGTQEHDEITVQPRPNMGAVAIVPLAMPLIIGPGGISTVIIHASAARHMNDLFAIVAAGAAISVICYLSLLAAAKVSRWLGETGLTVLNRIMGMLLAAVAVEIVIAGIRSLFPQLTV